MDDDCAAFREKHGGGSLGEARRAAAAELDSADGGAAAGRRRPRGPHGLGDPRASRLTVLSDFLLFCKVRVLICKMGASS